MKIKILFSLFLMNIFFLTHAATKFLKVDSPPSATISYNSPFCLYSTLEYVNLVGTTGGTFSASPSGLFIDATSGDIHPNESTPGTYTVTYDIPAGVDPAFSTTTTITIAYSTYPNFALIAPICPGSTPPVLPTTSPNGITGTWSPSVINNQQTNTYVFIPNPGQCANLQTIVVNVVGLIQPEFTFSTYNFCIGEIPILPTISDNGITGSWNPPTISTTEITIFTPDAGQCAATFLGTFSVSPLPTATISGPAYVCYLNVGQITISGTPNAAVVYTLDGGANQTVVLNSSGLAYLNTGLLTASQTYDLVSIYDNNTGCSAILNASARVTFLTTPVIPPIANVFSCQPYVLPPLTQGNYYTDISASGTMLHAGDVIDFSRTIYVFEENACYQNQISFNVSINSTPTITHLPDVTACQYYELPINNEAGYYTEPHGGGTHLSGNIYSSQTIYMYIETGPWPYCTAEDFFYVTIIPATNPEIISDTGSHYIYFDGTTIVQPLLLDSQLTGNYTYQWYNISDPIPGATSATYLVATYNPDTAWHIFVKATNLDTGCVTYSSLFWVYQSPVPAPIGNPIQTFNQGQTLADLVVSGSNIQWYSSALNRNSLSTPLPLNTLLVNEATYFASQTINGFESLDRLEVTVQLTLAEDSFLFKDLKFSPNPIVDWLTIQSKDVIKNVTVYTIMGEKILQQNFDSLHFRLSLSELKTGNYFIKLESYNRLQVIKVIKE